MTESFVTQCPNCSTSFRVNLAQLGTAKGAVRCGACLQVFNAAKQLREQGYAIADMRTPPPAAMPVPVPAAQPEPEPEPEPEESSHSHAQPSADEAKPASTTNKPDEETLWIHDDLDLDDLDLDEELAKLEEQEQQLSQQFRELDRNRRASPGFDEGDTDEEPGIDERWAEELIREEQPRGPLQLEGAEPAIDFGKPPQHDQEPEALPPIPPTPGLREVLQKQQHDAMVAERDEPTFGDADVTSREQDPHFGDATLDDEDDDEPQRPSNTRKPQRKQARNEPDLDDEPLFELEQEPLQLDWQPRKRSGWRLFGWTLLTLLAAAALAGQYVIYHYAELARQDQYRPWFEQACPIVGCSLPSKVDIEQIRSSNLVVRSHPEFSGALVVDAILYNRAPFSQPFPLLEMRFADLNGQLIASRRFKPSEYLAGELAGQAEMPPQTPIHIALDILDPGARAVNYSLNFHSPE